MLNLFSIRKSSASLPTEIAAEENFWTENLAAEGQLSVDIYQTEDCLFVISTIAGIKAEDLDISLHNDLLNIRGRREMKEKIPEENYLCQECYWGPFSRSIILPAEVENKEIEAILEDGILTVKLFKSHRTEIKIKEQ